jgi:threonine aldolase
VKTIDLRSDTVTKPSPAMREAMYRAEVGDDGYGEDPTVTRLQEMVAERVGMEASLFAPSGIMANMLALLGHCGRGGEVILGNMTDMYVWECGGYSVVGGIHPYPIANNADGTMDLDKIEAAIREEDMHFPRTQLVCIENSHNECGGVPLTPQYTASVIALADRHNVPVHVDGARIFNAAIAQGTEVKELTRGADSLMFCLSKGLACPVGSMVCGSRDFIAEAVRNRKMLGGQMRQAGMLAAAGIVAMEQMIDRLAEDHSNARLLADLLSDIKGLSLKPQPIRTNMVFFRLPWERISVEELEARLHAEGVGVLRMHEWLRAVTHYGIVEGDVREAATIIRRVIDSI